MRQVGLHRCGLTPGLFPRRPLITDDVSWVKPGCTCDSTAKGYMKKKCFEMIEKENTEIRLKKNTARNCAIRNTMTNSTSKQQHCSGRTSSKSETRNSDRNTCQVHTHTYSCVIPQFTVHLRSCQVQAPCC